ncbi:MAG: sporulation protein YabP [Peptococcaceae bacterium]|nr:sporulation protein YabP [Candidatus Syntrophopropionicum ammoniitolerans]
MEEKQRHSLAVYGRKQLVMEGVIQVDSFDETEIVLETNMGTLILKGAGLHITQLSKDTGGLTAEGTFNSFQYAERKTKGVGKSILKRMFK